MARVSREERLKRFKKWIRALRSGEFQQTFKTLRSTNSEGVVKYCALGVASACAGIKVDYEDIQEYYKLPEGSAEEIITMNDRDRKSLKEIAAFVQKTYVKPLTKALARC